MAEDARFTISIEQVRDYEFTVRFDGDDVPDLVMDEPTPVGSGKGPSASRILAAAVGNCLTASLLFCLRKSRVEAHGLKTQVEGTLTRNDRGRVRIGGLDVRIDLDAPAEETAKLDRCLGLFEDYCMVTESVRSGIPVEVEVYGSDGRRLVGPVAGTSSS